MIPIAWGGVTVFDHPDGVICGREFQVLTGGTMFQEPLGGIIGLPVKYIDEKQLQICADNHPVIYGVRGTDVDALKPHQEEILMGFASKPWDEHD